MHVLKFMYAVSMCLDIVTCMHWIVCMCVFVYCTSTCFDAVYIYLCSVSRCAAICMYVSVFPCVCVCFAACKNKLIRKGSWESDVL